MPELAEVEYNRKQWDPGLGQSLSKIRTHSKARIYRNIAATGIQRGLKGRSFVASHAHGKQMMFEFSDGAWMGLHLGMTGKLHTRPVGSKIEKHDHLVLDLEHTQLIFSDYRMFGKLTLDVTEDGAAPEWWQALPPQPQERGFNKIKHLTFARRFPKTPIKTLLLDQRGYPGVGNWMADEICWRAQIAPQSPSGSLSDEQIHLIWKLTRQVSRDAIRVISTKWETPPKSWLFTHRWKDGGVCPRRVCGGAELERADLRGRTTCWCPVCQPG